MSERCRKMLTFLGAEPGDRVLRRCLLKPGHDGDCKISQRPIR